MSYLNALHLLNVSYLDHPLQKLQNRAARIIMGRINEHGQS